jgi:hypothetical protein
MNSEPSNEHRNLSAAEARALLEEHRDSDMNIAAFARAKGVKPWARTRPAMASRIRPEGRVSRFTLRQRGRPRRRASPSNPTA